MATTHDSPPAEELPILGDDIVLLVCCLRTLLTEYGRFLPDDEATVLHDALASANRLTTWVAALQG